MKKKIEQWFKDKDIRVSEWAILDSQPAINMIGPLGIIDVSDLRDFGLSSIAACTEDLLTLTFTTKTLSEWEE